MRTLRNTLVVVAGLLLAQGALAQDPACAAVEKRFALEPLKMAAFLSQARCLGGDRDSAAVTQSVRQLVPTISTKPGQRAEMAPVDQALALIAAYLREESQGAAAAVRPLVAAVASEVEAARDAMSRRLPLRERDAKGWEWQEEAFAGLPALDFKPLDITCASAEAAACKDAAAAGRAVFRAAALMAWTLAFSAQDSYHEALAEARVRDAKWNSYFDQARMQWPWELALNGWRHGEANKAAGGFAEVPTSQWILFHPGVGMEYVRGAAAGSRLQPSLVVELVGYNRWSWTKEGGMAGAFGASLIQTYSDRAGVSSSRPGLMLHYQNKYSIAFTRNSGATGIILSTDLAGLMSKLENDVRTKFKLKGSSPAN